MIDKIVELLRNNSNILDIVAYNTPSTITFVGSVNYEDIAKKIAELFDSTSNPIIQIYVPKSGQGITTSSCLFPEKMAASLVIKHLELAVRNIKDAVEKEVNKEFGWILTASEFTNDTCENDWIESATHLMPMGRLLIEESKVFWIKNPKG